MKYRYFTYNDYIFRVSSDPSETTMFKDIDPKTINFRQNNWSPTCLTLSKISAIGKEISEEEAFAELL